MKFNISPISDFSDKINYHIIDQDNTLQHFTNLLSRYKDSVNSAQAKDESEEHFKKIFNDFFRDAYGYDINTHRRIDSVITIMDNIRAIIEVKRPQNQNEYISDISVNYKAFHEILLYYYELRSNNVHSVNTVIITDCRTVYLFKASELEKIIKHKDIAYLLSGFKNKELSIISTTSNFYNEVAKIIDSLSMEITGARIDLFADDKLIADKIDTETLYRAFDKHALLNVPIDNKDHNVLNKDFYYELLYIMGLYETVKDGIPVIQPLLFDDPTNKNNLLTLVKEQIDHTKMDMDVWLALGDTQEERLESMALELVLTWVNRILFLKLLEAQLVRYHVEDKDTYKFLEYSSNLDDWDEVYKLFFDILAKPLATRGDKHIPYLNSSLFEKTELEQYVGINFLNNNALLTPYSGTVLKENNKKSTKALKTLEYFLKFLDCYNFGRGDDTVSDRDRLINASVLGLIFEKLNGYKDGAVYTPSFITMSMSRESLRKTVIQKFNDTYDWDCEDFESLKIKVKREDDLLALNKVFNTIRVCDPAVGSGHFLVSVLNELLLIKYELKILCDKNGDPISRCDMKIISDELIITYGGKVFTYEVDKNNQAPSDIHTIQETLFHEKETLIENCLFGVDLNPKSAYICQLRLWIELLKNTYYSDSLNLQTLPNIDINIKIGNSLVSRFKLKQDFSQILNALKGRGISMAKYRELVNTYKNATDKTQKSESRQEIREIKQKLRDSFLTNDVEYTKLLSKFNSAKNDFERADEDLYNIDQVKLAEFKKKMDDAKAKLDKADDIYRRSLEWRYEFPEVLDDEGNFLGFDLVIGNPPYIQLQSMNTQIKNTYKDSFSTFASTGDIYQLFIELGLNLINEKGRSSFIISNKWMRAGYGASTRKFLHDYAHTDEVIDMGSGCFDNVTVDTNILSYKKRGADYQTSISSYIMDKNVEDIVAEKKVRPQLQIPINVNGDSWIMLNEIEAGILAKMQRIVEPSLNPIVDSNIPIFKGSRPLKDWNISINRGVLTGFNDAFIVDGEMRRLLIESDPKSEEIIKPLLRGRDIKRYSYEFADKYLINIHNGYRSELEGKYINPINIDDYPAIKQHLDQYLPQLEKRQDKGITPYNLRNCAYLEDFDKPKIVWGNISYSSQFCFSHNSLMINAPANILTHNENDINELLYIFGILNSLSFNFQFTNNGITLGQAFEWKRQYVEPLFIPIPSKEQESKITDLVKLILDKKEQAGDTTNEELEIDEIVYQMYGLSEEEIKYIENKGSKE